MAFNFPGSATVNISGQVTQAQATYASLNFLNVSDQLSSAVPAGKIWIVKSVTVVGGSTTNCYVNIDNGAGTDLACLVRTQGVATYSDTNRTVSIAGECVAILTAGQRFHYSAGAAALGGCITWVEVTA